MASYYNKPVQLWVEEDAMSTQELCDLGPRCKSSQHMRAKKELDITMKFLMNLNDIYILKSEHKSLPQTSFLISPKFTTLSHKMRNNKE